MRLQQEYYILDGLISSIFNMESQKNTNRFNERMSREDRAWQEMMVGKQNAFNREERLAAQAWTEKQTQALWTREDTANQRAVVDAVNAGLSPLAVVGSGGAPSSVVTSSPSGASASAVPTPASYRAQSSVMNLDMSSLIGAVMDNNKINLDKERLSEEKRASRVKEKIAMAEVQSNHDIAKAKLLQEGSQFEEMRAQEDNHFLMTYAQNAEQFSAQTTQQAVFHYDDLAEKEKERKFQEIQDSNKMYCDMARSLGESAGVPVVYYPVTTVDDYNRGISAISNYLSAGNRNVLNNWKDGKFKTSEQSSEQSSLSGGAGAFGVGSANIASSSGASAGETRDNVAKEAVKGAYLKNGVLRVPVLVRSYAQWEKEYSHLNRKSDKKPTPKKSDNAPNRTITEFNPSGQDNVYNPFVRSKVWSKK